MLYCNNNYQEYQFTAFAESDLTNGNLGVGDTFTMPGSATVEFTVTDNDSFLSGDSWHNENATDYSGQTAEIILDGAEIGNGNQIYAEQYFWANDGAGNWYLMIEIEQEGSSDDYFTFHDYYGVPEEGAELTIYCSGNVSCWQPDYKCLTGGDVSPPAALMGRFFMDADGNDVDNGDAAIADATVTLTNVDTGETFTTTTLADGTYSFQGIAAGDYTVSFAAPDGKGFIAQDVGGDDTIDSDVDVNGVTMTISIGAGDVITNVDAGVRDCGLIEGTGQNNNGGMDLLIGCESNDTIKGLSGDDTLEGRGGDDEIIASRGSDILVGGTGNDTLDGGEDTDIAVFSGNAADYAITLTSPDGSTLTVTGPDGTDTLIDIEVLRFDDGDLIVRDFLLSAKEDVVAAPSGPGGIVNVDVLANDLAGPSGTPPVVISVTSGGFGTAVVEADGTITYTAGATFTGSDVVSYTITDTTTGSVATGELVIGAPNGPDAGTTGATLLSDAGETVEGDAGDNIFVGGAGDDNITGKGGNDQVSGQGGNDTISGSQGDDLIDGGSGDDVITGNLGNDTLNGGAGNDRISGSGDDDIIFGGDGDDVIATNPGNDFVYAGNGNDQVTLNAGDEFVFGGAGADNLLKIGVGADTVYAGDGNDTMTWKAAQADAIRDLVDGQSGVDTLNLTVDAADAAAMQAEVDAYITMVDALSTTPQNTNGVNINYSFTTIELDIANIEAINLSVA